MEKMNQVSVSEFFAKSKEEMYDMAVEMVEKYNRLVDICNDSAERMAEIIINVKNSQEKEIEAHEEENKRLSEKIMELKKERDKYMARVNDLRMELDCVKASKEKHEEAAHDKVVEDLRESFKYWRTKCLAAQEEIEKLKVDLIHEREKNEKLAKNHAELENELRKRYTRERALESTIDELKNKEDDHGKSGFTEYIKYIIGKEEEKFKGELNRKFSEEVSKISMQRTEEELTKVKMNEKFGAKTVRCTKPNDFHCVYGDDCPVEAAEKCKFAKEENSIPCGEDAIE